MLTRRTWVAGGSVALTLLLTGCGASEKAAAGATGPAQRPAATGQASTGPQQSSPPVPAGSTTAAVRAGADPCALITQQEASAAFGAQSSPPQPATSAPAGGKACAYFADASRDSLQVGLLRNAPQPEQSAIESSVRLPGAVTTTASGIGNSAMVMRAGPTVVIIFTEHTSLVILTLTTIGQPAPVRAATVLAMHAAARL